MSDDEVRNLLAPLWSEFKADNCFPNKRPLLAHYTKADSLESVLKHKEVWFSHPCDEFGPILGEIQSHFGI
jgi:hypothetical protein